MNFHPSTQSVDGLLVSQFVISNPTSIEGTVSVPAVLLTAILLHFRECRIDSIVDVIRILVATISNSVDVCGVHYVCALFCFRYCLSSSFTVRLALFDTE